MNALTGIAMLAIAAILIVAGRPDKAGKHRKFLRFQAALVLYPPVILIFFGLGVAALISALMAK